MSQDRVINLVFQGGGVRGIAYAGVLSTMPDWLKISGVGGTSAGALVAALLATGKRGKLLRDILSDPELFSLLRKEDVERRKRITDTWHKYQPEIQKLLAAEKGLGAPSFWGYAFSGAERKRVAGMYELWQSASQDFTQLASDLEAVWKAKGFHSAERLRAWLDKVLENKKFGDLATTVNGVPDLRIVAANINSQEYQVYSAEKYSGMELAEAVQASVSVPIFFEPFVTGGGVRFFVDGGILSNFPSFLFAQSPNPTIGFRLEDVPPLTRIEDVHQLQGRPLPIRSTLEFILLTLKTMVEAHDKFRELPPDFHLHRVPVPDDIPFDKFDLTIKEADRFYDKAATAAPTVEVWDEQSRPSGKPRTFDPKPQHALTFGIEQGAALMQRYYSADMWADSLDQTVDFQVTIDRNWGSSYVRTMKLKVEGDQPIFLMRVLAFGLPKGPQSLADHVPKYQEIGDGSSPPKPVILIPASNGAEEKGFVAFLDPPVRGGTPARNFWMEWRVKEEFMEVSRGGAGLISYRARQLAKKHALNLKIRVRVDQTLGEMAFQADNGEAFVPSGLEEDPVTHIIYRIYTSGLHELPVYRENGVRAFFRRA
jgi:predicted acylesterase/phospholipase RssA